LHRFRYDAKVAQRSADSRLKESRGGINCTEEEFKAIINIVKPLLKQGLGLDAIWCEHQDELGISKRTFYRWADKGLGVANIELPKKVAYRPRKKKGTKAIPRRDYTDRSFEDFMKLCEEVRMTAFEMDCVEGIRTDKKVILTLLHKRTHFQFGMLLNEHTTECVVAALDWLEMICEDKYADLFSVILTDRGHEFSDIDGIETGKDGTKRTSIYFCDPQRPDQKAQCERAHVDIRAILPKKKTSFDALTQEDVATIFSHINSVPRSSLGGTSPMVLAQAIFPKRFFEETGLRLVAVSEICLKPSLLDNGVKEGQTI
jgi:IS30 family transposase